MTPRQALAAYAAAFVALLLLDSLWLTTMAPRLYRPALGALLRPEPDLLAAAVFYGLYLGGVVAYAVRPALPSPRGGAPLAWGAGFGLVAYATYDLTNQATLVGWPWWLTAIDLIWGMLLTAVATLAGWWAARRARAAP